MKAINKLLLSVCLLFSTTVLAAEKIKIPKIPSEVTLFKNVMIFDGKTIGGNDKWFDAEPREQDVPSIKVIMKDGKFYKNTL